MEGPLAGDLDIVQKNHLDDLDLNNYSVSDVLEADYKERDLFSANWLGTCFKLHEPVYPVGFHWNQSGYTWPIYSMKWTKVEPIICNLPIKFKKYPMEWFENKVRTVEKTTRGFFDDFDPLKPESLSLAAGWCWVTDTKPASDKQT